jgi:hypothetical protein
MWTSKLLRVRYFVPWTKVHIALTTMLRYLVKINDANVSIPLKDIAFSKVAMMESTPVKFTELVEDF